MVYLTELLVIHSNTWNHLTVFKNEHNLVKRYQQKVFTNHIFIKLVTIVESDTKVPFSLATNRSVGESATPFPGLSPLIRSL